MITTYRKTGPAIMAMPTVSQITQRCIPSLIPGAQGSSEAGSRGMCWRLLFFRETDPGWTQYMAHTRANAPHEPQEQTAVTGGNSLAA